MDRIAKRLAWGAVIGIGAVACAAALAASIAVAGLWRASDRFAEYVPARPSRLWGAPLEVRVGDAWGADDLASRLVAHGYRAAPDGRALRQGGFRLADGERLVAVLRGGRPDGRPPARLEATFDGGRVAGLSLEGREVGEVILDPPLLATYHGPDLRESWPVDLDELPEHAVEALLAAEDHRFFRHSGLSAPGIARAAWINLRAREIRQGGSTITQQLVKNLYLTREKTMARKLREALLALLVEGRYDKEQILEAYLNEAYWGVAGRLQLIGIGAAARAYFGVPPRALELHEAALLAAMLRSPGEYSPLARPAAARVRRDVVLARMEELGWIDAAERAAAAARPLDLALRRPDGVIEARHFAAAAAAEARERFGVGELAGAGYDLYSTLDPWDQRRAVAAVREGLAELDGEGRGGGRLEAALVSLDPRDGQLLAYLGGRSFSASQFDRASRARRQAGSAFKPVVYATALAAGVALPGDQVDDTPILVRWGPTEWRPENEDRTFRGPVTVRRAVEQSLNVPTVRVAVATGLRSVAAMGGAMGLPSPREAVPALSLGALEVTPLELATAYGTLAAAGVRPGVHGLLQVSDPGGGAVDNRRPPAERRVLDEATAYLVTHLLQGAIDHGTGWRVRQWGIPDRLAGKTGTSDGRRDSWFAGYSPDRVTVVWVGRDDNRPTGLSGARGALPVWSRFVAAVRPAGGFPPFEAPEGVVAVEIDPETGFVATPYCPVASSELYPVGRAPTTECPIHAFPAWADGRWGGTWIGLAPQSAESPTALAGGPLDGDVERIQMGNAEEGVSYIVIRRTRPGADPGGR